MISLQIKNHSVRLFGPIQIRVKPDSELIQHGQTLQNDQFIVPSQWLVSKTLPKFKSKSDKEEISNYRQFSNLCTYLIQFQKIPFINLIHYSTFNIHFAKILFIQSNQILKTLTNSIGLLNSDQIPYFNSKLSIKLFAHVQSYPSAQSFLIFLALKNKCSDWKPSFRARVDPAEPYTTFFFFPCPEASLNFSDLFSFDILVT